MHFIQPVQFWRENIRLVMSHEPMKKGGRNHSLFILKEIKNDFPIF